MQLMYYNPVHSHAVLDLAEGEELGEFTGPGRFLMPCDGHSAAFRKLVEDDRVKEIRDPLDPDADSQPVP